MNGLITLILVFLGMVGLYLLTFLLNKHSTSSDETSNKTSKKHDTPSTHSGGCACGHSTGSCSSQHVKLFDIPSKSKKKDIPDITIDD